MNPKPPVQPGTGRGPVGAILALALVAITLPACAGGGRPVLPDARPIVIRSGARVFPEKERMLEIDTWFRAQVKNIEEDPSFWIITRPREDPTYPWETLYLHADSAEVAFESRRPPEAAVVYQIYAHFHLMKVYGRLGEFLPEAADSEGFLLERAILTRVAEAWLLGRAVYLAEAYEPLEELVYANENGYLDALILTARGEEFGDERRAWLQEDPGALERYRSWFVETFSREPPGLRGAG